MHAILRNHSIIKISFCLVLLFLIFEMTSVLAQSNKTVLLTYNQSDFSFVKEDGLLYISSSSLNCFNDTDTTKLALPYIVVNVLVNPDSSYSCHQTNESETIVVDNVDIAPNPLEVPTFIQKTRRNRASPTYAEAPYLIQRIQYLGTHMIGQYKYLNFKVYPFRYDANARTLYMAKRIALSITMASSPCKNCSDTNPFAYEFISSIIENKEDLGKSYPIPSFLRKAKQQQTINDSMYNYIIVTRDSLKDVFQRLANWKTLKGIKSKVITIEEIDACMPGATRQLRIKKVLKDYYDKSNHSLQYVLLGGDGDIVPAQTCRHHVDYQGETGTITIYPDIPSDLYYGSFSVMDWDLNGDGVIKPQEEVFDYSPSIIATRLSVCSIADALCQIDRIIRYEQQPNTENWEDKILLSGASLDHNLYGDDRQSDTHIKNETIFYPNYIRDYWQNGVRYMFYDTGTSFTGGRAYHFRTENLQEQLSNGYSFIHVETHGEPDSWKMEWRSDAPNPLQLYTTQDAFEASNAKNTIITTTACLTNAFDSVQTSLSEAFMRNPNAGALAYYGCSHFGWHHPGYLKENPTSKAVGFLYKELFLDRRHQIGRAVYNSKKYYLSDNWHALYMNALCDPEMPVFLEEPIAFNSVDISYEDGYVTVNTGLPDCRICVSSYNDYGDSYYEVVDSVGSFSAYVGDTACYVCVTKQGYMPYLAIVGNNLFIQNETFLSDVIVRASTVRAGLEVNNQRPQGSVIFQSGNSRMQATNEILLDRGFEVKKGASLEITTVNP